MGNEATDSRPKRARRRPSEPFTRSERMLLTMVVALFAGLFVLIGAGATGFVAVHRDLVAMQRQIGGLRSDLEGQIGDLRSDLEGQIGDLRTDLGGRISAVEERMARLEAIMEAEFGVRSRPADGPGGAGDRAGAESGRRDP